MNDSRTDIPDEADRIVLMWQMSRIRADLAFALGWKKTQARTWEQRCRQEGVHFKMPHAEQFSTHVH